MLTWLVPRKLDFCILQPLSNVLVQAKGIRGREVNRDIKLRRDPVHKLELLRMDHKDFREGREPGSPAQLR